MKRSLSRPKITTVSTATASSDTIKIKIENATEGLSYNCFNLGYYLQVRKML